MDELVKNNFFDFIYSFNQNYCYKLYNSQLIKYNSAGMLPIDSIELKLDTSKYKSYNLFITEDDNQIGLVSHEFLGQSTITELLLFSENFEMKRRDILKSSDGTLFYPSYFLSPIFFVKYQMDSIYMVNNQNLGILFVESHYVNHINKYEPYNYDPILNIEYSIFQNVGKMKFIVKNRNKTIVNSDNKDGIILNDSIFITYSNFKTISVFSQSGKVILSDKLDGVFHSRGKNHILFFNKSKKCFEQFSLVK